MVPSHPGRGDSRVFSLHEQARALAVVLREEFGTPFVFHDAATGDVVYTPDGAANLGVLDAAEATAVATEGRARVLALEGGRYRLALLLYAARKPALVAGGVLDGLARADEAPREQARLQSWLQAVSDRLRLADQLLARHRTEEAQNAQATVAWEALLGVERVARGLRVYKDPEKNRRLILEGAFSLLDVQSVVWVPPGASSPVLIQGECCLAPADCRQFATALAPSEGQRASAALCNDPGTTRWAGRYPRVANLIAYPVVEAEVGWVIAFNKRDGAPFRRTDQALLAPFAALFQLHQRNADRYQELKDLLVGLTRSLASALDAKDSYTFGHSERVARIAVELARELGLDADDLGDVYLAGLLHDVGKIGIHDAVLRKPANLTPEEQDHIRQHVTIGYAILAELKQLRNLLPGVLYHHEHYNGSGYPDGLKGEDIPLLARILAVADAYDAMSNARPYRNALPSRRVEEILTQGAGAQWDRRVVEAFQRCRQRIHIIRQQGVGDSLRVAIEGALRSDSGLLPSNPLFAMATAAREAKKGATTD